MMDLFVDNIAKPEVKGSYFGAMGFSQLGSVIGPFVGGLCIDYFGAAHPSPFYGLVNDHHRRRSIFTHWILPSKKRSAAAIAVKVSGDH